MWNGSNKPNRPVSDPLYKPLKLRKGTRSTQAQSILLNMPAEIRLIIWDCVVARDPVLLYQRDGRVAYDYLTDEGPQKVQIITPGPIRTKRRRHEVTKVCLLAMLQTCQMM
jgi:hypothetical protein